MTVAIRRLESGEQEIGRSCFAAFWRKDHILATNDDYFSWQFSPPALASGLGFWIAEDDGRIVGCMGDVALQCHVSGRAFPGSTVMHTFVEPHYRRYRVGLRFMEEIYRDRKLVIGMFGTPIITEIYRRLGQYVLDEFPRYGCITDDERFEVVLSHARGRKFVMEEYGETPRLRTPSEPASGYRAEEFSEREFDEWDAAWKNRFAPSMRGVAKDASYLSWRYLRHPIFKYDCLLLRDANEAIRGIAVTRTAELPGNVSALRVLEFFADGAEPGAALASAIYDRLPANSAYLECSCLGDWWAPLRDIGVGATGKPGFSIYFNPPNNDFLSLTAAFHVDMPHTTPASFMCGEGIYLTIGDSDTDVPAS